MRVTAIFQATVQVNLKMRVSVGTEMMDKSQGTRITGCNDKGLDTEWSRSALR